jgi:hypothetical protein
VTTQQWGMSRSIVYVLHGTASRSLVSTRLCGAPRVAIQGSIAGSLASQASYHSAAIHCCSQPLPSISMIRQEPACRSA